MSSVVAFSRTRTMGSLRPAVLRATRDARSRRFRGRHRSGPFLHNATRAKRESIILEAPVRTATRTTGPLQASARVALQHLAGTHRTHSLLKSHAHRVANHGTFRLVGGFTRNEHSHESPLFSSLTDKRNAGTLTASIHHVEFHNQCRTTCQPHPTHSVRAGPYQHGRRTRICLMDAVCGRGAPRVGVRCAFGACVLRSAPACVTVDRCSESTPTGLSGRGRRSPSAWPHVESLATAVCLGPLRVASPGIRVPVT